jgi:hypothetical protein
MAARLLQAGVPEGGGEVVEELLRVGVVLLMPLAGRGRLCIGGLTGGRAAAELGAHRRCGRRGWSAWERNWMGCRAPVGRGGAAAALDRGSGLTVVAVDDDQGQRRRSGEGR